PVRRVAGEVVVIAGVVVAGAAAVVAERTDDGQVVRLAGQVRQVFAQRDTGRTGGDGAERAAVFLGRVRLHVPQVDVRGPAAEPDQNGRTGRAAPPGRSCLGFVGRHGRQVDPEKPQAAGDQKRPPVEGPVPK